MDPVSLGVGGVLLLTGYVVGRAGFSARTRKPTPDNRPICLCEHHYGTHDQKTGACNWKGLETMQSTTKGAYQVETRCSCLRYVGPMPVETYWVPPAADMNLVTAPRPLPEEPRSLPDETVEES